MELHRMTEIVILNVENPNKFWFRTIDHQTRLEEALKSYLKAIQNVKNNFRPKNNEVIVAKIRNQFKIVRVRKVDDKSICISILETGEIRKVDHNDVKQLSEQIRSEAINSIFMGSISSDIVPAIKVSVKFMILI